jgi:thiamine kinase-like enzyme
MGYVHNDLKIENILVVSDGIRVIDWQRPIWGPVALDEASLLLSLGIDPLRRLSPGVLQLRKLLSVAWSVECAQRWFPDGAPAYDAAVASIAQQI